MEWGEATDLCNKIWENLLGVHVSSCYSPPHFIFHFPTLCCLRQDLYLFTVQIFRLPQWVCSWWWRTRNDSLKVNLSRGDFQTARVSRQRTYSPQGNISQGNLPLSAGEGERPQLQDLPPGQEPRVWWCCRWFGEALQVLASSSTRLGRAIPAQILGLLGHEQGVRGVWLPCTIIFGLLQRELCGLLSRALLCLTFWSVQDYWVLSVFLSFFWVFIDFFCRSCKVHLLNLSIPFTLLI